MGAIAKLTQFFDDGRRRHIIILPRHAETTIGVVQPRIFNAFEAPDTAFNIANAGRAIDPFDREIDAVQSRSVIMPDKGGEIDRGGHGRSFRQFRRMRFFD